MRGFVLILLLAWLLPGAVKAQGESLGMSAFGRIPVMHEGRLKPMESFARVQMVQITGEESPHGIRALDWLARIVFDPASMEQEKIFTIRDPALKMQLGLDGRARRFSLADLQDGLRKTAKDVQAIMQKDASDLTNAQGRLLAIHDGVAQLTKLGHSLSLLFPITVELPQSLKTRIGQSDAVLNYLTLAAQEIWLQDRLKDIIVEKGEDPQNYTEQERQIALLAFQLEGLRLGGKKGRLLKIMPTGWGQENRDIGWYGPWEQILQGKGSPESAAYLEIWAEMAEAYRAQDALRWNAASQKAYEKSTDMAEFSPYRFEAELIYALVEPYLMAKIFYALAVFLCLMMVLRDQTRLIPWALTLTWAGIGFHIFGLAARIYILQRPPVGTLHESVLFVSLICAFVGLWMARGRNGSAIPPLAGNASALFLLAFAPVLAAEKDSLEVLVAVLNTNFWLATHVLVITAGYGVCILAAGLAHFYLYLRLFKHKQEKAVLNLYTAIHKISVLALLLTAVGTVLGGIWADQSWGRFWGWDPKENGALLIVLWLIWAQHGRLSGHLRDIPFAAAMAFLNVIVALAWFGVNLLSVGLHSYGFISGIAWGLGFFCAIQTLVIAVLWVSVRLRGMDQKQGSADVA